MIGSGQVDDYLHQIGEPTHLRTSTPLHADFPVCEEKSISASTNHNLRKKKGNKTDCLSIPPGVEPATAKTPGKDTRPRDRPRQKRNERKHDSHP
jgi:hypothetical protein